MRGSLACLLEGLGLLFGRQSAADGTGLLRSEVQREVLLVLVEQA